MDKMSYQISTWSKSSYSGDYCANEVKADLNLLNNIASQIIQCEENYSETQTFCMLSGLLDLKFKLFATVIRLSAFCAR